MKGFKMKFMLGFIVMFIALLMPTFIFASNEGIQILSKNENEYMMYIQNHTSEVFEFALTNEKDANKDDLIYRTAVSDLETSENNYIAYIDSNLYNEHGNQTIYVWARDMEGTYFAKGIELDLSQKITNDNVIMINNLTNIIKVNTVDTLTTEEMDNEVKITKTVGKIDLLEEGKNYYQLVKLPSSNEYNELSKQIEKLSNKLIENDIYKKIEAYQEFMNAYNKLVPTEESTEWKIVENNQILQPEDSKNGDRYIVWLKNENENETKIDLQLLTCFEDYKPEVISEKTTTVLPKTGDNLAIFIVLATLIILLIVTCIVRVRIAKTEKNNIK